MNLTVLKSYSYKPQIRTLAAAGVLFGICAAAMAAAAATNERGLLIDDIIELGVDGASAFYWVLSVLSLGFATTALWLIIGSTGGVAHLQITPQDVRIPRGFFRLKRSMTIVPFLEVNEISETTTHGQRFLNLHTVKRNYAVAGSMMPSDDAYEEVKKLISAIVAARLSPVVDSELSPKSNLSQPVF
jgi:hypothetical protein